MSQVREHQELKKVKLVRTFKKTEKVDLWVKRFGGTGKATNRACWTIPEARNQYGLYLEL